MKKIILTFTVLLCLIASQFFGIGLDLSVVYAADLTGTTSGSPNIYNFITDLKITQTGSDNTLPPDLGSDVPKDGSFRMTYYFEIPEYSNYQDDDYFYLILPDYVDVPAEVTNVAINDTNYGTHVLDVSMLIGAGPLGEDVILVDFAAEQYTQNNTSDPSLVRAYSGQFWFEANFDADEVGTGGPITIEFDSGRVAAPYNIEVDFEADPPPQANFTKSNNFDSSNPELLFDSSDHRHYITWTLDINSNNVDMGTGVVIEDVIDTTWMEIWPDTTDPANPIYVVQTTGSAGYTADYDTASNTLTITFSDAVTSQQVFTYQTAVLTNAYIDQLSSGSTLDLSNQATIEFTSGDTIPSNESSVSYTIDVINKDTDDSVYTDGIDYANRRIYWVIEANPNNYIVDDAFVTDSLPSDFTMEQSSIKYEFLTSGITYSVSDTPFDGTVNYTNTGQDYQFNLGDISETVLITFSTTYNESIYYTQTNEQYTNYAYFRTPTLYTTDARDGEVIGFSTEVISKTATGADYTDIEPAYIQWQLVINPSADSTTVNLTDIYITDILPTGLTLHDPNSDGDYSDAFTLNIGIDTEVPGAYISYDPATNEMIIDFDTDDTRNMSDTQIADYNALNDPDLERNSISQRYVISYQTDVAPGYEYYYKQNEDTTFTNTASFESYNAGSGQDSASRTLYPQVLNKYFYDYDYDTHYITWQVRINVSDNDLYNPLFVDYIPEGMTYVDDSLRLFIDSTPYALDLYGGYATYTAHDPAIENPENSAENTSGTLEYSFFPRSGDAGYSPLNCITDDYYLYFETEFTDYDILSENYLDDGTTSAVTVGNTSYLHHDQDPPSLTIQYRGSGTFTSSVIEKDPRYSSGDQFIDWVVTINKNQIEILGPNPDPFPLNSYTGPVIYDTLQEGLIIDLESIVLYDAEVHPDGTVDVDPDNDGTDNIVIYETAQVGYDANTRQLTFEFAENIDSCYVMTFTTYIDSDYTGPFSNTASFHALAGNPDDTSDNQNVLFATGGGFAASNIGHLLIKKVDSETNLPLDGATFELIDSSGRVIDVQQTDINGEALFEFVFFDRDYYYRESAPPYGYSGDTTTIIHFVIDSDDITSGDPDDPDRVFIPDAIANTANPVTVQFMKYTEDGATGLQGATFQIFTTDSPPVALATAVSNAAGLVTFSNLHANRSYNIVEIAPPIGYLPDSTVLAVSVTVGDVPFTPTPSSVTNQRDSTAVNIVIFTKYAEDGTTPLEGCVFGIYSSLNPSILLGTAQSQTDGSVTFNNVPPGEFIIRELSAPSGYNVSSSELTVVVGDTPGTYETTPDSLNNYPVPPPKYDNPQTGDTSLPPAYIIIIITLALYSALCAVYIIHRKKAE